MNRNQHRHGPLSSGGRKTSTRGRVAADDCSSCAAWELRCYVAVRASYYLTLHLGVVELREVVLEHMTAAWALRLAAGDGRHSFDTFFEDYRRDVERDRDESTHNTALHTAEFQRLWTNHAAVLSRRLELLQPRFVQAAA